MEFGTLRAAVLLRGQDYRQWIDDTDYASPSPSGRFCPRLSLLRINDLANLGYGIFHLEGEEFDKARITADIAETFTSSQFKRIRAGNIPSTPGLPGVYNTVTTYSCAGVLILDVVSRANGPHASEIALAMYNFHFQKTALKLVYVTNVVQEETIKVVRNAIYAAQDILFGYDKEKRGWGHGTEQYDLLLGTPIGAVVGAIVLGQFGRGTHYISKIWTWTTDLDTEHLDMRFDIEKIDAPENTHLSKSSVGSPLSTPADSEPPSEYEESSSAQNNSTSISSIGPQHSTQRVTRSQSRRLRELERQKKQNKQA
ncbi:hypothetical protein N7462_003169 [Penicillium macrosclerotiorum]|uniref:uncharacterized protein n=1 Tax=Penicillium macrosclerotiorum TaxID=303699 RepID=UPI002548BD7F|nr:uncharacterized protein N7462_003169 [Penicillium macrosclerotiorum]KAJ5688777.1 hypothetical protein N7462_003169 [Penicillium macrosclerotiorum]